jgi:hypothetical protein
VESVDRNYNASYAGWVSTPLSVCAVCYRYEDRLFLWKELEKVIHTLSTGESDFGPNPYLGEFQNTHLYMGV